VVDLLVLVVQDLVLALRDLVVAVADHAHACFERPQRQRLW